MSWIVYMNIAKKRTNKEQGEVISQQFETFIEILEE